MTPVDPSLTSAPAAAPSRAPVRPSLDEVIAAIEEPDCLCGEAGCPNVRDVLQALFEAAERGEARG